MFTPLSLCQDFYRHAKISPASETFDIDPHVETGLYHTSSTFSGKDQMSDIDIMYNFLDSRHTHCYCTLLDLGFLLNNVL